MSWSSTNQSFIIFSLLFDAFQSGVASCCQLRNRFPETYNLLLPLDPSCCYLLQEFDFFSAIIIIYYKTCAHHIH